mmetsp:Transcript_26302/g.35112  ORF Transcript_26302/g.35112 Transcript_26302/m.35112 type:complete len:178 (-) Transcript_26302:111-644(-)
MKFVAECYNYKVIHTDTLFCVLYKLINWDLYGDRPDETLANLDSPSDCFRVRLVCTILDSMGPYFSRGKRRLLMDRFLIFFQRYIYQKNYIYMDLEFMLLDTFDGLRAKNLPKVETLDESNAAVRRIRQAEAYLLRWSGSTTTSTNEPSSTEGVHDIIQSYIATQAGCKGENGKNGT